MQYPSTLRLKVMDFDDLSTFKLPEDKLLECYDFISGGPTLVVCTAGRSRSAAVCIAYLIKRKGMTLKDATELVRKARPIIEPNSGFMD